MNTFHNHIPVKKQPDHIAFTSKKQNGEDAVLPVRNRISHSQRLMSSFQDLWDRVEAKHEERSAIALPTKDGAYIEFRSQAGHELITKSLEDIGKGIRLLNVRCVGEGIDKETVATVFIPSGQQRVFLKKLNQYANENTIGGHPKNRKLVDSVEDIQIAILEALWTDPVDEIPTHQPTWCEIWLRTESIINGGNEAEVVSILRQQLEGLNVQSKGNYISFPERAVILCYISREQLVELLEISDNLAEIRLGQEAAGFWVNEKNADQVQWVADLLDRLVHHDSNVKICILDSGVNNGHPLINPVLSDDNCMTVNPLWGVYDHEPRCGHGTLMSGVAAYGQLEGVLLSTGQIDITHALCAVKIIPPGTQEQTPIELWGSVTEQAVSRAEIQCPEDKIVFCMAVSAMRDVYRGRPSSWSGAVDNIAFGRSSEKHLIIISGGNILSRADWENYPESNRVNSIQNPAQSWNGLTVGAYTEKTFISDVAYADHEPLAPAGGLSPFSSTSILWEKNKWPTKPDVVFEGGNILRSPGGDLVHDHEDYGVLSTSKNFINDRHFDTINATSAATAQASWMAAKIMYEYPEAWPETVRGLMVHSAVWTEQLIRQFDIDLSKKAQIKELTKIAGYGVPSLEKALYTTNNSLTYLAQETIQPYRRGSGRNSTNEMHLYELPWPKAELEDMGDIPVEVKVTLSYFIEPGPGEVGWKDRYRYASFGLRFDIKSPTESTDQFKKRVNVAVREDEEKIESNSQSGRWLIGKARDVGSIHSDIYKGTAAEIASCNVLAVYPVIGWWRERSNLKMVECEARYSLVVSLKTPATEIDLYTPVITKVSTPITVVAKRHT